MWFAIDLLFITIFALSVDFSRGQSQSCSSTNSLRLYNQYGNTTTQGGMLQICISSQWRAVCDYGFDCSTEGRVACRQLGYSGSQIKAYALTNSARYFGTWSNTDSYYYYCSSSSYSSLTSCSRHYRPSSSYCNSDDQVGLWCATVPSTACSNGTVQLVGGLSSNEGRLEYCYNGAWTQLCKQSFHHEEATAACRQLGYTNPTKAVIITDPQRLKKESNYSLVNYFSCPSPPTIRNLSSCGLFGSASSCGYRCTGNNIGISCYDQDNCREGAVKLVNSTIGYEGRVEVCLDGVWGTVCEVDQLDAAVICRTAGFDGVMEYYSTNQMFGDGGRPIFYSLQCSGCESNIKACNKTAYPNIYCSKGSVAGVRCSHGCTDGEVRLTGGSSETEGTVEVCHNKTWGMVSGLGWGEEDARVTCRQLHFSVEGFHSYVDSPFGKPRRTVHFSAVQCVGNESRITDCVTTNYTYEQGKLLAGHLPVAGVTCQHYCPISTQQSRQLNCNSHIVAISLLALLSATFVATTVILTLVVCYCYFKQRKNQNNYQGMPPPENNSVSSTGFDN